MLQKTVIVLLAATAAAFFAAWVGRRLWLRRVRRMLVVMFGRKEALASAVRSLRQWMEALAEADGSAWASFLDDDESVERRALSEITHRADVVAVELAATPLPGVLHDLAEDIEDLARTVREMTDSVEHGADADEILDALGIIDLALIMKRLESIEGEFDRRKNAYGVTDSAVYGGGMYI